MVSRKIIGTQLPLKGYVIRTHLLLADAFWEDSRPPTWGDRTNGRGCDWSDLLELKNTPHIG